MSVAHDKPPGMTIGSFVAWSRQQPDGRYELVDGEVVAMPAEGALHNVVKGDVYLALREAIARAGLKFTVFTDGMLVPIRNDRGRQPDAAIASAEWKDFAQTIHADPLVLVEVNSPSSITIDSDWKLAEYFELPSVRHYLIVSPARRHVIHHSRKGPAGDILTRIVTAGTIALDPPGIEVAIDRFFATVNAAK